MGFKKKLYALRPDREGLEVETQRTKLLRRREPADPRSIERGVRQLLADKVCGTLVGLWLLVPEHLRLGTWDLLCGWCRCPGQHLEPRLALQVVHEAALCTHGRRAQRSLSQRGFELANGLPFLASDPAIHDLLDAHTVAEAEGLQATLGQIRRARGHYRGSLLVIDPHRTRSYTKRHVRRYRAKGHARSYKMAQTFFCLDAHTGQPVAFTTATAALLDFVHDQSPFDLLVPAPRRAPIRRLIAALAPESFTRRWAGFATAKAPYAPRGSHAGPYTLFIERSRERPDEFTYGTFLCTADRPEVDALSRDFPQRWHVEEFLNANQTLGWDRAGTLNLHIRYGQMTFALLAQAVLHQLPERLGDPCASWEAAHFAQELLAGLEGDIRVADDTILVTYYNALHADRLRPHYEDLPQRLERQHIDPRIPWLYGLKLNFRFK